MLPVAVHDRPSSDGVAIRYVVYIIILGFVDDVVSWLYRGNGDQVRRLVSHVYSYKRR